MFDLTKKINRVVKTHVSHKCPEKTVGENVRTDRMAIVSPQSLSMAQIQLRSKPRPVAPVIDTDPSCPSLCVNQIPATGHFQLNNRVTSENPVK